MSFPGEAPALFFGGVMGLGSESLFTCQPDVTWIFDSMVYNNLEISDDGIGTAFATVTLTVETISVFSWTTASGATFQLPSYEPLLGIVVPPGAQCHLGVGANDHTVTYQSSLWISGRTIPRGCYVGTVVTP